MDQDREALALWARQETLRNLRGRGWTIPAHLPVIDVPERPRSEAEIVRRALALHLCAAVAYGLPRAHAMPWLMANRDMIEPTAAEIAFLKGDDDLAEDMRDGVGAIEALCWTMGVAPAMDVFAGVPETLVQEFPNPKRMEPATAFAAKAAIRPLPDMAAMCDLIYCLHWYLVDEALFGRHPSDPAAAALITHRRRAVDWVLSAQAWDDIPMDT